MSSGYDKYVRGKVLGKGSFGQAVLVTRKSDGKNFVIKEIDISRMPKVERDAAEQEAKVRIKPPAQAQSFCIKNCTSIDQDLLVMRRARCVSASKVQGVLVTLASALCLQLLMALNHPNIVRCLECFTHQSKLCIVMDWCSEGGWHSHVLPGLHALSSSSQRTRGGACCGCRRPVHNHPEAAGFTSTRRYNPGLVCTDVPRVEACA